MSRDLTRQPNFALLLGLAWLVIMVQLMAENWAITGSTLHDTDDALRLVQVRAFLAGRGWFDLHEARLGGALGYDTHWSRLPDIGIAGLLLIFQQFTGTAFAERLTVAIWPMLWVLPTMAAVAAIAWRIAGREAALLVLLLAIFDTPGLQQFRPGRIDHHNVQIAFAVLAVAATVWSDRLRWTAWAAGALTGFGLAIGLEALHIYALCGAAFVMHYVIDRDAAPAMRAYGLALTLSVATGFLLTVGPSYWARSVCDSLAINSASALALGGLAMTIAGSFFADGRRGRRLTAALLIGGIALATLIAFEPRCLAGPYGLIDPAIRPIWLADVAEDQTLLRLFAVAHTTALATAAFPACGALAAIVLLARPGTQRSFGGIVAALVALAAAASLVAAIRNYSYAIWCGLPLVAALAVQLFNLMKLQTLVPRFLAALLLTPTALTLGAINVAQAAGTGGLLELNTPDRQACARNDNYAALARLPTGRVVVNQLEWGPYLLAWTPHSVLAAPYHRLAHAILGAHQIFASPPDEARRLLASWQVNYVAICGSRGAIAVTSNEGASSLFGQIAAGNIPPWLEKLSVPGDTFSVYRVKS
jgi:hypothetical protein